MRRSLDSLKIIGVSMQLQIPLPSEKFCKHTFTSYHHIFPHSLLFKFFLDPSLFELKPSFSLTFFKNVSFAFILDFFFFGLLYEISN